MPTNGQGAAVTVLLRGGDVDESPMAYRRPPDVLREHGGTIRILHTLRPFVVAMAGQQSSTLSRTEGGVRATYSRLPVLMPRNIALVAQRMRAAVF
jgi:hypothetical protein